MQHARHSPTSHDLLENETALETFPEPERAAVRVAAGYPAPYRVAMSNLGFHFLYGGLRRSAKLRVERFFSETSPVTLESGARLSVHEALLCSISYEEDYLNLVRMLHESGIPALRTQRRGKPLVIVGGPAVSANPFPLAEIVDAAALGEGEGALEAIAGVLETSAEAGPDAVLDGLARIPGMFLPGHPQGGVEVRGGAEPPSFPRSVIVTPETTFPGVFLIECGRGCPGACSFCLATSIYRPYRYVPLARVVEVISSLRVPVRKVGLISTAVAASPDFVEIVRFLAARGYSISFSSLRAEDIDDEKAALIGAIGTASVSLAPESASESVRFRLGKRVPDETYLRAAARLREAGVRHFTLYLLIGWPPHADVTSYETRDFIESFRRNITNAKLDVHVNPLVPKAWTPLQFAAMPRERELSQTQELFEKTLRGLGVNVRTKSVRSALRQALFSVGDERVGRAIVHHVAGGISWRRALRMAEVDERFPHEEKGPEASFPWDAIQGPVRRGVLFKRFEAMSNG